MSDLFKYGILHTDLEVRVEVERNGDGKIVIHIFGKDVTDILPYEDWRELKEAFEAAELESDREQWLAEKARELNMDPDWRETWFSN